MCPDLSSSNLTTDALGASFFFSSFLSSAATAVTASARAVVRARVAMRYTSDALLRLDGDVFELAVALDEQFDFRFARRPGGDDEQVGDVLDLLVVDLGDHVALLQAG